eukprot:GHVS01064714.1.p1 GENE.GHVS01064714.1~~GHVS01064714.1.p1  ORF type:complete len:467 (-),score=115.00 GHVS01064714.1:500-1900(-)
MVIIASGFSGLVFVANKMSSSGGGKKGRWRRDLRLNDTNKSGGGSGGVGNNDDHERQQDMSEELKQQQQCGGKKTYRKEEHKGGSELLCLPSFNVVSFLTNRHQQLNTKNFVYGKPLTTTASAGCTNITTTNGTTSSSDGTTRSNGVIECCTANRASEYAVGVYRGCSESVLCSSDLFEDIRTVFDGQSIYLPCFGCDVGDTRIYNILKTELNIKETTDKQEEKETDVKEGREEEKRFDNKKMANQRTDKQDDIVAHLAVDAMKISTTASQQSYCPHHSPPSTTTSTATMSTSTTATTTTTIGYSRHQIHPNPESSACFMELLSYLRKYFDLHIHAYRLNFYPSIDYWKPYHHDSHAYSSETKEREDFTVGFSFGAERELSFLHVESDVHFGIPQRNGDLFAFNSNVNRVFKHGVPKGKQQRLHTMMGRRKTETCGGRISVIAWGRRERLTERNAGGSELMKGRGF